MSVLLDNDVIDGVVGTEYDDVPETPVDKTQVSKLFSKADEEFKWCESLARPVVPEVKVDGELCKLDISSINSGRVSACLESNYTSESEPRLQQWEKLETTTTKEWIKGMYAFSRQHTIVLVTTKVVFRDNLYKYEFTLCFPTESRMEAIDRLFSAVQGMREWETLHQ